MSLRTYSTSFLPSPLGVKLLGMKTNGSPQMMGCTLMVTVSVRWQPNVSVTVTV